MVQSSQYPCCPCQCRTLGSGQPTIQYQHGVAICFCVLQLYCGQCPLAQPLMTFKCTTDHPMCTTTICKAGMKRLEVYLKGTRAHREAGSRKHLLSEGTRKRYRPPEQACMRNLRSRTLFDKHEPQSWHRELKCSWRTLSATEQTYP